jgi:hypothetical protein
VRVAVRRSAAPRCAARDALQISEGWIVVVSHDGVGLVGDDGTDQAVLASETGQPIQLQTRSPITGGGK